MTSSPRDNHQSAAHWSLVASLCALLDEQLESTARTLTTRLRQELPVYRALAVNEHQSAVGDQLHRRLVALAERRTLDDHDLRTAAELAEARATIGVPIDAVIAAYQAGDRELWRLILTHADAVPKGCLPELASLILDSTGRTTSVMAEAHSRVARAMDGGRIALSHQLMDYLDQPADDAMGAAVAGRLGLDPTDTFVALVWQPPTAEMSHDVQQTMTRLGYKGNEAVGRVGSYGRVEMVVRVGTGSGGHLDVSRLGAEGGLWGIGAVRPGLPGAAESLADARLALRAASSRRSVIFFEADWLDAVVMAQADRVRVLLGAGVAVAQKHPHLAETVVAFAQADMSIASTAAKLHLHANSVTYRLERWQSLTGIDVRTFRGLSAAVVACELARVDR